MDRFPYVDADPEYTGTLKENDDNSNVTIEELGQRTLERRFSQDPESNINVEAKEASRLGAGTTNKAKGNQDNQNIDRSECFWEFP